MIPKISGIKIKPALFWIVATLSLLTLFQMTPSPAFAQTLDPDIVRDQLLDGVTTMADPGGPGTMVVWGENAYAIANYKNATGLDPMMAFASWEQGRVIAMPDHQWLNMDRYGDVGDTGRFYRNGLSWLADSESKDIKIIVARSSAKVWLEGQGYTNVTESNSYATLLDDADVLVGWLGSSVAQSDLDAINAFVQNGGGLFLAEYGIGYNWWWGKAIPDAPGNKLLHDVGIGFTSLGTRGGGDITPTNRIDIQLTANDLLAMLADPSGYSSSDLENGATVLNGLFNVLPEEDPLLAQLDTSFWERINTINPTPSNPVSDTFEQALLSREAALLQSTPAQEVTAHRTAAAIYGTIPADAPRVNRTVTLNTANSRWLPTGFYAVPGEVVTITVPASLVGKGYKVRINAHNSNVYPRSSWERPPEAHRWFSIDSTELQVANAFGGLIFIDVGSRPPALGNVEITLQNVIEAPYFVLGQHSDQEWNATLRNHPAPYTLLVGEKLMIAMPTHDATALTEPTTLMTLWDQVVTLQDDLADQAQFRTSPELMNIDVQIGYGAAHAGYPYQAYDKHWGNPADLARLQEQGNGSWGDYHELGHNHQRGWWTFPGDGEVTVNIFSNYTLETMNPNATGGWAWSANPIQVMERAIYTVQVEGGTYASKSNRWAFWYQLADGFGWDAYADVFRGYEIDNASNPGALPTNTQEEKDQWLVRFSLEVGYDMTQFMRDTWGLAVTQGAVDQVSHLPAWMPVIGTTEDIGLPIGLAHTFDFAGDALALDGVATVTAVTSPANGILNKNDDGTYTYTPNAGFDGKESFTYTLKSSGENTETFTVNITTVHQSVRVETWTGIGGTSISDLTSNGDYPDNPDTTHFTETFVLPSDQGSSYGARLRAYLIPPTTGTYTFWIASDDNGELWLGNSDDAATAQRIGYVSGWTGVQQWDRYSSQKSANIELVAGKRYYIEALMKEGSGGDHLAVAWQGPGITRQVISSEFFQVFDGTITQYVPVAQDDTASTDEDVAVTVNVLTGDSDENGDALTVIAVTQGNKGRVANNSDGIVTYMPNANIHGNDSFTYTISDGNGGEATATVQITINSVNDVPNAVDDRAEVDSGVAVVISVLTNDRDVDGDSLAVQSVRQSANGGVVNNGNGTVTYTSNSGFSGNDSFTYTINDGNGGQATATVQVTVVEVATATALYFSSNTGGRVDGIRFADEDVLAFNPDTKQWSKYFDGSDVGLSRRDVNAFHILGDGDILLSLNVARTIAGIRYDDSDIIKFTATSLGNRTRGTFSLYLDGSDVQLSTNGEDIDAISLLSDGDLVISTLGTARVNGVVARDEDLIRFSPSQLGSDTQGTWSLYLDGTDIRLNHKYEDIWAAWIDDSTEQLYFSTLRNYTISSLEISLTGDSDDIISCANVSLGDNAQCELSRAWDGDAHSFGNELIDGYSVGPAPIATVMSAAYEAAEIEVEFDDELDDDLLDDDEYTEHLYLPLISQ